MIPNPSELSVELVLFIVAVFIVVVTNVVVSKIVAFSSEEAMVEMAGALQGCAKKVTAQFNKESLV